MSLFQKKKHFPKTEEFKMRYTSKFPSKSNKKTALDVFTIMFADWHHKVVDDNAAE